MPQAAAVSPADSVSPGFNGFSPGFSTPPSSPGLSPAAAAPSLHVPDVSDDPSIPGLPPPGPAPPDTAPTSPGPATILTPDPVAQHSQPTQLPAVDLDLDAGPQSAPDLAVDLDPDTQLTQPTQLPDPADLPSLDDIYRTQKPTLKWIPAQACVEFSREFSSLADRLTADPENIVGWKLWAMFVFCVVPGGKKDKRTRRPGDLSLVQLVKSRLRRWRSGEAASLWSEALAVTRMSRRPRAKPRAQSEADQEDLNAQRATQYASEGHYAKALKSVTSAGLAPATAENLRVMEQLHPRAPPPTVRHTDVLSIKLSNEEVKKAVFSMPTSAAAGPDSFRPSHFRAAIGESAPGRRDRALASLTKLVNSVAAGHVPPPVRPYFASAKLHGLLKKGGGIRPLACGCVLRRITARVVMRKLAPRAAAMFSPTQLGVSVAGGCEAAVHGVRAALDEDPELWCLQTDLKNAYNSCSREHFMEETEKNFPEILELIKVLYGDHSFLFFGEHVLTSEAGTAQGCPLGILLWTLAAHPVTKLISESVRLRAQVWFADDATFCGHRAQLQQVMEIISTAGPERGLILSTEKTVVWSPHPRFMLEAGPDPLGCSIKKVEDPGITVLGSPIGSEQFIRQELQLAIQKVRHTTAKLSIIGDSQIQFVLLRATLGLSKLGYLLRTTDFSPFLDLLHEFDAIQIEAMNDILGAALSPAAADQTALPMSLGGFGLRRSRDFSPVAYTASVVASMGLILKIVVPEAAHDGGEVAEDGDREERMFSRLLTPAVLAGVSQSVGEEVTLTELAAGVTQKVLTRRTDEYQQQKLVESMTDVRDRARLAVLARPKALAFLSAVPNKRNGTYLRPEQFSVVTRYLLGEQILPAPVQCRSCNQTCDVHCHHMYNCHGVGGEVIGRHDLVRDGLALLAKEGGFTVCREPRFLLADGRRPADVYLAHSAANLNDECLDVVVCSVIRDSIVDRVALDPGLPMALADKRKERQVGDKVRELNMNFVPMSISNFGSWSDTAINMITRIGRAKSVRAGTNIGKTVASCFQRLGILLMRGNSELMLNRLPYIMPIINDSNNDNDM